VTETQYFLHYWKISELVALSGDVHIYWSVDPSKVALEETNGSASLYLGHLLNGGSTTEPNSFLGPSKRSSISSLLEAGSRLAGQWYTVL
jgi:hypothetical protein